MARLPIPTPEEAPAASRPILDAVKQQMGMVPNVVRILSNSPVALQAFVTLQGTNGNALDPQTRNAIALAVTEVSDSAYCRTAHSFMANTFAGATPAEIKLNREGKSGDARVAAAASFGQSLIENRGKVSDEDLASVRAAGYSDAQIVEIIAVTAQVLFTNFVNNVADTEIDIPVVKDAA